MASTAAASSLAMPLPSTTARRPAGLAASDAFLRPARPPAGRLPASRPATRLQVRASMQEKAVTGLTAAALAAALVLPDVAEAAQPGISPSLKNFLLSIAAGGVVLVVILGAVIAVSNFDPVKRS
uniref:Photosystem II reaction center X protein n=1 Tax=Anthurium amnicola TaxID=1678845 RepID=A0A1D1XC20_9ARAE